MQLSGPDTPLNVCSNNKAVDSSSRSRSGPGATALRTGVELALRHRNAKKAGVDRGETAESRSSFIGFLGQQRDRIFRNVNGRGKVDPADLAGSIPFRATLHYPWPGGHARTDDRMPPPHASENRLVRNRALALIVFAVVFIKCLYALWTASRGYFLQDDSLDLQRVRQLGFDGRPANGTNSGLPLRRTDYDVAVDAG